MQKKELIKNTYLYYERLKSRLEVYLIPLLERNAYYASYGTKYGSVITKFKINDKVVAVPNGIAHFLEHKMFENKDGSNPFDFYASEGASCNAATNYFVTEYLCWGNHNPLKSINHLYNFVNNPYFTDANVEKEKGIISEEIKMYDDEPNWVLLNRAHKNIFHNFQMKYDVGGTIDDINKITKEDLYNCYNAFYQPRNMFLIVAGNFDYEKLIKEYRKNYQVKKEYNIEIINDNEPKEVVKEYEEIVFDIEIPKISYNIKIARENLIIKKLNYQNYYLNMFLAIKFGLGSTFKEKLDNNNLALSFSYTVEAAQDYILINFYAESNEPKEFIKAINKELESLKCEVGDLERIKKVWISNEIRVTSNASLVVDNIVDDLVLYGKVITNRVNIINKMNIKTLTKMLNSISFQNKAIVVMNPKEKMSKKM